MALHTRLRSILRPAGLAASGLLALGLVASCTLPPGPSGGSPAAKAAEASPLRVRLLAINDFHGHLEAGSNSLSLADPQAPGRRLRVATGGAATLAGLVRAERAAVPHSLLLSAGDLVGASPLASSLFRDEPTIEVMNAMGLALNAVGNHEFDGGLAELQRLVMGGCADRTGDAAFAGESCADPARPYGGSRLAPGPGRGFLAANVVDVDGRPVLPPYAVHRFDGVAVGFIGVVTRTTPTIVMPAGIWGLRFLDEAETLNRRAAELKAQGVRAIVAIVHEGGTIDGDWNDPTCPGARGPIFDIERRLSSDIAVVFSGHSHQGYACRMGGPAGRVVMQAYSFGRGLARVDLALDRTRGTVDLAATQALNLPVVHAGNPPDVLARFPPAVPDAAIAARVDEAVARAAPRAARPLGQLAGPATRAPEPTGAGDHAAGRLIADAQLAATRAADRGGARLALMNPGGIRGDFACRPAPCSITFGDAFTVQPFGNSLVVMTLSGTELAAVLEQQATGVNSQRPRLLQPSAGFSYRWNPSAAPGQRASDLRLEGRPVAPGDSVRVTVNSFLAEGGDGFTVLTQGRDRTGGPLDIEALAAWLKAANGPLLPPSEPRILRD